MAEDSTWEIGINPDGSKDSKKVMDLGNPILDLKEKDLILNHVKEPAFKFNIPTFITLYNEDGLGNILKNVEFWLRDNWTIIDRYIKDGPLYVVIPNSPRKFTSSMDVGEKSGLPAFRYQFHFPSNQYMDPADRQIDLVEFLGKQEEGLKEFFKPEFMKGLTSGGGNKVSVNYPGDSASKFIALYGFEEFFETLPENIIRLEFVKKEGGESFNLKIPSSIGRFKEISSLHLVGCVAEIPEAICELDKLQFLSLPNNPNLRTLPSCVANLPRLSVVNVKGSNPETSIPDSLKQRNENDEDFHLFM